MNKIILSIIGFILSCLYIWNRFFRIRLPKDIPLELSFKFFFILIIIISFHLFIIIKIIKKTETKLSFNFLYQPFKELYSLIINKNEKLYDIILEELIDQSMKKSEKSKFIYHVIYLPQIITVSILFIEIFIIGKIRIFYISLMFLIIPILYKIGIYILQDFMRIQCNYIDKHLAIQWNNAYEKDNDCDYKLINAEFYVKESYFRKKDFDVSFSLYLEYINELKKENPNCDISIKAIEDYEISILDNSLQKIYFIILKYTEENSSIRSQIRQLVVSILYIISWGYVIYISNKNFDLSLLNLIVDNNNPFL
jgi:hypothetical protein